MATVTQIEVALAEVYSGRTLATLDKGAVPVPVFVDSPDPEEYPNRVFPSVSIMFAGMRADRSSSDSEEVDLISVDEGASPPVNTTRRSKEWYKLRFTLHTWTLDAQADRDLVLWVESRLRPRDSITVAETDETFWCFRSEMQEADSVDKDRKSWHKLWSIEVVADIENTDTDETTKAVTELRFDSFLVKTRTRGQVTTPVAEDGSSDTAEGAARSKHRSFAFDQTRFWIP